MPDQVKILVGTRKAAFIYTSDLRRERWSISEPILPTWSVYDMSADVRGGSPRLYAAANHWAWGRSVAKSTDIGKTWDWVSEGLGFPEDMGIAIQNVWCITPGHEGEDGAVYAGVQPAGLFRSEDWGRSWASVDGLNRHERRQYWSGTGGGDSCVHSVVVDPRDAAHAYACISSGGSYETHDGGRTWGLFSHRAIPENPGGRKFTEDMIRQFGDQIAMQPDIDPLAIGEMHKMVLDEKDPDRLWTQTHVGVFRSADGGENWEDVTAGLPSFHGFPIAVSKQPPDAAYVVPLGEVQMSGDNFRVCQGQLTVYRTRDSGKSWEPLTNGLPGPDDYQSVYREGLDTDGLSPEGVYVGTSNGEVYAGLDEGDRWQRLPGTLPPVLSVTAVVV